MDKFGIFNLLSSLFNGNNTNSDNKIQEDLVDNKAIFDNGAETKSAKKRANLPPLQNSMLLTMKTHDEFIKRVKARQSKQQ